MADPSIIFSLWLIPCQENYIWSYRKYYGCMYLTLNPLELVTPTTTEPVINKYNISVFSYSCLVTKCSAFVHYTFTNHILISNVY